MNKNEFFGDGDDFDKKKELDWKKAVMLKIEEGLHEKGYKLIDLYKFMDL